MADNNPSQPCRARNGEHGFALLVVLWSLVLITLLTTQILSNGRIAVQLAANLRNAAIARASDEGAINAAVFHLAASGPDGWAADGTAHVVRIGEMLVTVRAESLAGEINPNLASTALLAGLFRAVGASPDQAAAVAAAITAWRSPAPTSQATKARIAAYQQAGLPYGPPAQGFNDLGELADVIGMTPPLLAAALPYMSLYQSTDPDPSIAGPIVRRALALAGQPGSSSNVYDGSVPVVSIEAVANGPVGRGVRCNAIVSIAGPNAPVPYTFLAMIPGY